MKLTVGEAKSALAAGPIDLPDDEEAKAGPKPFDDLFGTFCSKNAGWEERRAPADCPHLGFPCGHRPPKRGIRSEPSVDPHPCVHSGRVLLGPVLTCSFEAPEKHQSEGLESQSHCLC